MWGNIAQNGCVVKRSAVAPEMLVHSGPARVFDGEESAIDAIYNGRIQPGDVVVIRYEGPVGGPGMREMLNPTSALAGMEAGQIRGAHHRRTLLGASAARPSDMWRLRPPWAEISRSSREGRRHRYRHPGRAYRRARGRRYAGARRAAWTAPCT